jgi:translation initiation factor 2 subunit 3
MTQAEVNIGLVGHVDHGKTTLTKSLSGVWTDKHSEEIKRGISIRLGYAEINIYKCDKCPEPDCFCTSDKCNKCGGKATFIRKVSFVDAPGHETLIATMLSGAALMDGVILVVAADEKCPQPQTIEHLLAIKTLGVKKIIVVQNKVDVVDKENALENKKDIEALLSEFGIEAVIIPTAANYDINKDVVLAAIEEFVPTPKRKNDVPAKMSIARSFDINKPGDSSKTLKGGVLGGSLSQGILRVGDEIEIRPGIRKVRKNADVWESMTTKITALNSGDESFDEVGPGGLVAVQTTLDPYLTKSDKLSGNVLGIPGSLPPTLRELDCDVTMLERKLLGDVDIKVGEPLMLTVGTTNTVGVVRKQVSKDKVSMDLKLPVVASPGDRFAISKRVEMKWRLIGFGVVV